MERDESSGVRAASFLGRVMSVVIILVGVVVVMFAGLLWIGYGMSDSHNLGLLLVTALPALLVGGTLIVIGISLRRG